MEVGRDREDDARDVFDLDVIGINQALQQLGGRLEDQVGHIRRDGGSTSDSAYRHGYTVLTDVRLIAIPSPSALGSRGLIDGCRAAEAGGVSSLQVRLKTVPALQLLRTTQEVMRAVTIPVYVNDRADVAVLAGAAGVHLGADDLPASGIRTVAPRPVRVGVSVGTAAEADRALRADADYWSIGPFYHTPTKTDAGPALGAAGFQRLASLAPKHIPVVAIGGITPVNVTEVLDAGADGVAVIGAIFAAPDVTAAARILRDRLDSWR